MSTRQVLVSVLVTAVVVVPIAIVVMSVAASSKVRSTEAGWAETFGTREEILERFPAGYANGSALETERLTSVLGIDIAPRQETDRERPTESAAKGYAAIKRELATYVKAQLEQPRRGPAPPPDAVAGYLRQHAGALEALRSHLKTAEVPRWEQDIGAIWEAPIPNLLGHIELQRLLIADALARAQTGDHAGALADLDASWRLNASLWERPVLITQLIAISVARMQAGTLRQLEDVPEAWRERLFEHDSRASFLDALRFEGWVWSQVPNASWSALGAGDWTSRMLLIAKPYVEFCMADISGDFRERLVNLARVDELCDNDLAPLGANLEVEVPRWNLIGDIVVPTNVGAAVDRLARLEVDLELTARILELDTARTADGTWPDSVRGSSRSEACPNDAWVWSVSDDDELTIALSREVVWPDQHGAILPLRHVR